MATIRSAVGSDGQFCIVGAIRKSPYPVISLLAQACGYTLPELLAVARREGHGDGDHGALVYGLGLLSVQDRKPRSDHYYRNPKEACDAVARRLANPSLIRVSSHD